MFKQAIAAALASSAASVGDMIEPLFRSGGHHMGRTRYIGGYKPPRSKYRPHQGKAEIARRLAQAERKAARA